MAERAKSVNVKREDICELLEPACWATLSIRLEKELKFHGQRAPVRKLLISDIYEALSMCAQIDTPRQRRWRKEELLRTKKLLLRLRQDLRHWKNSAPYLPSRVQEIRDRAHSYAVGSPDPAVHWWGSFDQARDQLDISAAGFEAQIREKMKAGRKGRGVADSNGFFAAIAAAYQARIGELPDRTAGKLFSNIVVLIMEAFEGKMRTDVSKIVGAAIENIGR